MVAWHDGVISNPSLASDTAVREAARALRVRFPADFLAVARLHQGAVPIPGNITLPDGAVTAVQNLLHFEAAPGMQNIVARMFPVAGVLDKGVIPFAEDIGGDLFCFNYRQTPDAPTVVFWSVDTGMVELAANFTEFVALLHD
ncbi:MAG: SMI1/KNR4 family protein [Roseiflexaceae bacterium]|nr:SMI1/KNR4 family protein [Roseiflexaceae bacterium]